MATIDEPLAHVLKTATKLTKIFSEYTDLTELYIFDAGTTQQRTSVLRDFALQTNATGVFIMGATSSLRPNKNLGIPCAVQDLIRYEELHRLEKIGEIDALELFPTLPRRN